MYMYTAVCVCARARVCVCVCTVHTCVEDAVTDGLVKLVLTGREPTLVARSDF
jgi:hypothetical protein